MARYELIRAAACIRPGCCTTAAFLKRRIHGALQHYLRDHGRLVRVSRREHEKGLHPWRHQSLDALGPSERPYLDDLASPESEEPAASEGLGVSAEALLQRLPANEAAILRLWVLEGQSLRRVAGELGISTMTVSRYEKAALAALREQLASAPAGPGNRPQAAFLPWALPTLTVPGNPEGSCPLAMALTTADIGIQLLMHSTVCLQEIEARITARVFTAVLHS